MDKIFFRMPCLSETRELQSKEIYERLFDKRVDKRYLESSVQKFVLLNKKMLSFLGIDLEMNGIGHDLSIKFKSSGYIGAIPIKMPYDGIAHKDLQVIPKFERSSDAFSELTQLLSRLEYSIAPEYYDSEELSQPLQLKPPMYYEAAKYIDLFEQACRYNWVKFEIVQGKHPYPKSNTNWNKHAMISADPVKALTYPSSDSVLSVNHKEWQELKFVFDLACSIILQSNVPASIHYKYSTKIASLKKKVLCIRGRQTDSIMLHASDPVMVKKTKTQANVLLQHGSTSCVAWRIDMAQLFERYVQHVVLCSMQSLGGMLIANNKIRSKGRIAQWGLKYLEPDMMIKYNDKIYMADAKYKAHYYSAQQNSESLKETHRGDLHQLLAYCSFSPEKNKIGILFYPSVTLGFRRMDYLEQIGGVCNTIYLYGIPFGINEMDKTVSSLKQLFAKQLL